MLEAKVNVNNSEKVAIIWKPDNEIKDAILKAKSTKEGYCEAMTKLISNALSDTTAVCSCLKDYLKDKLGEELATVYQDMIYTCPELLFAGAIKKHDDEKPFKEGDIRNADFY